MTSVNTVNDLKEHIMDSTATIIVDNILKVFKI